jgi:hypothetical protein
MKRVLPLTVGAVMPVGPGMPWGGRRALRPRHTRAPHSSASVSSPGIIRRAACPLLLSVGIRPLRMRNPANFGQSQAQPRSIPLSLNVEVASLPECHDTTTPEFCFGIGGHHPPLGYKLDQRLHFVEKASRTNRKHAVANWDRCRAANRWGRGRATHLAVL